ncbi:hypothetical protein C8F01DRAFT_1148736 [Mycena amicta]|nr:hypothetical protein C8F01DRAFT_1148736 [Mycena amicta]
MGNCLLSCRSLLVCACESCALCHFLGVLLLQFFGWTRTIPALAQHRHLWNGIVMSATSILRSVWIITRWRRQRTVIHWKRSYITVSCVSWPVPIALWK